MTDPAQGQRVHPSRRVTETPLPEPKRGFRMEWILIPLALFGMAYVVRNANSAVTWEQVMDLLHVKNRERYTMLFHLCVALTFVVAAIRILGRKKKR